MTIAQFKGPKPHWLYGNLRQLRRDNIRFFQQMYEEYGGIAAFRLGPVKVLFVADHDVAYRVLVKEAGQFVKGKRFWRDLHELIGDSILRIDGPAWKRKRKLYAPSFHPAAIEHYSRVMTKLCRDFAARVTPGQVRDIHADMIHLTADIVCKCLFDKLPSDTGIDLVKNLDDTSAAIQRRRLTLLKLPHWVPTPSNREIKSQVRELDNIVSVYLDQELAATQPSKTLLSLLVHSKDEHGERLRREELRDEIMTLFVAGHETTALSATWAWYELSRNADVYAKLKQEVDGVLKGRAFTFADAKKLPYARAVLNESLRKYPPVPTIPRQLDGRFAIGGVGLPRGHNIVISPYVLHRDERYFPDPEAFRPERWLDDYESRLPKCQFMPFGAGARICIGNTFALLEGLSILATLTQYWEVTQPQPYSRAPRQQVTLRPDGDVPLRFRRRPPRGRRRTTTVVVPARAEPDLSHP